MNVLCVASEMVPFAKTGGLADVLGALPRALVARGHDVRVVLPLYDKIDTKQLTLVPVLEHLEIGLGPHHPVGKVLRCDRPGEPTVYFVHCPALYGRGRLYTGDADEHRRFLYLSYAALTLAQHEQFAPDVVHCHDWQAALVPLLLKTNYAHDPRLARARTLLTIHNLNYQGMFPAAAVGDTGLGHVAHLFHQDQLREGRVNFLLHGILYADGITTVSPTYAKEIQRPEHGVGLDPFLRARSSTVVGILNGVDYDVWSPDTDKHLPYRYSAQNLAGKARCKEALVTAMGLPHVPGAPVFGIVSRMAGQKGFGLVGEVMPDVLRRHGAQLVVLGSGEPALEQMFGALAQRFPRQVGFFRGFSDPLAHLIEAGADLFLMPSRYEPCGLNQMYSLRYGTVPIVHKTGGLADTVQTWNGKTGEGTGFAFEHHDALGLRWAIESGLAAYKDRAGWRRLMQNGMAKDFSWATQARLYDTVFSRLRK